MKKEPIVLLLLILISISCSRNKSINKESLLNRYACPEDSLKRSAASFLLDNMTGHTSDISFYQSTPDNQLIDNAFLTKDIDLAFQLWNKYPWADSVPFDIFLNYLLPYKVYGEKPEDWRSFFTQKYCDSIRVCLKELELDSLLRSSNEIYYRILVDEVGQWFHYSDNPANRTQHPGLSELMEIKSGDCYGWSYLNVMILRSLGIPSTIDYVPLWGRKNGTHYSEVFWDNEMQKFRTASGREMTYPAKVFRYTYKIQNGWTDS